MITLDQLPLADLLQWFQQQSDSSQFLDTQTATAQIDDATITNSTIDTSAITNLTATNATLNTATITNLTATTVDLTNTTLHNATATGTGGRTATIIDNSGNSSFLQLLNSTTLQCAFGTSGFSGTGANIVATFVAHGLGRTPGIVLATPSLTSTGSGWGGDLYQNSGASTTYFNMAAEAHAAGTFGVGYTYYFNWMAIG